MYLVFIMWLLLLPFTSNTLLVTYCVYKMFYICIYCKNFLILYKKSSKFSYFYYFYYVYHLECGMSGAA